MVNNHKITNFSRCPQVAGHMPNNSGIEFIEIRKRKTRLSSAELDISLTPAVRKLKKHEPNMFKAVSLKKGFIANLYDR